MVLRYLARFLLAIFLLAVAILSHLWLIWTNYTGLRNAFVLLGFETYPLRQDPLIGTLAEALGLGSWTFCDLYAAALALVMAMGLVCLAHFLGSSIELLFDRTALRREGRHEDAARVSLQVWRRLAKVAILTTPLTYVTVWDIKLFLLRSIANGGNIQPTQVPEIPSWSSLLRDNPDTLWLHVTQIGLWGYIAATALACILLPWAIRHLDDAYSAMVDAFRLSFAGAGPEPVLSPAPAAPPASATPSAVVAAAAATPPMPAPAEPSIASPADLPRAAYGQGTLRDGQAITIDQVPSTVMEGMPSVEVLGANPPQRVTMEEAARRSDLYYVDSSHRVWLRKYWDLLNAPAAA